MNNKNKKPTFKVLIEYDPSIKPSRTKEAIDAQFRVAKEDFIWILKKNGYYVE